MFTRGQWFFQVKQLIAAYAFQRKAPKFLFYSNAFRERLREEINFFFYIII